MNLSRTSCAPLLHGGRQILRLLLESPSLLALSQGGACLTPPAAEVPAAGHFAVHLGLLGRVVEVCDRSARRAGAGAGADYRRGRGAVHRRRLLGFADGVVDLYLMPAYDDIASLYYYGDRWNVHYMFPGTRPGVTVREAEAMPLSKETLEKVLAEMRQSAT